MSKILTLIKMMELAGIEIVHFQSASVLFFNDKVSVIHCHEKDPTNLTVYYYNSRDNYTNRITDIPEDNMDEFNLALLSAAEYLLDDRR